jgi:hypothetical protein
VVDIDVIKDAGQVWAKPLEGAFIPALSHNSLHIQRQALLAEFQKTKKDMKRDGGVSILGRSEKEAALNLFSHLMEYGVFVVNGGELESWLKNLGASGHGPTWLIDIFERMGENPEEQNYLLPSNGDVWDFIGLIKSWIENPHKKGIPL